MLFELLVFNCLLVLGAAVPVNIGTEAYTGKSGTISQASDLNCNNAANTCCWTNDPEGQIKWEKGLTQPRTDDGIAPNLPLPNAPYLAIFGNGQTQFDQGSLVSCTIPKNFAEGTISFDSWKDDKSYLTVCLQGSTSKNYLTCVDAPSNGGKVSIDIPNAEEDSKLLISATNWEASNGGLVLVNNIKYVLLGSSTVGGGGGGGSTTAAATESSSAPTASSSAGTESSSASTESSSASTESSSASTESSSAASSTEASSSTSAASESTTAATESTSSQGTSAASTETSSSVTQSETTTTGQGTTTLASTPSAASSTGQSTTAATTSVASTGSTGGSTAAGGTTLSPTQLGNKFRSACDALYCTFGKTHDKGTQICNYTNTGAVSFTTLSGQSGSSSTGISKSPASGESYGAANVTSAGSAILRSTSFTAPADILFYFLYYLPSTSATAKVCVDSVDNCPFSSNSTTTTGKWLTGNVRLNATSTHQLYFVGSSTSSTPISVGFDDITLYTDSNGSKRSFIHCNDASLST